MKEAHCVTNLPIYSLHHNLDWLPRIGRISLIIFVGGVTTTVLVQHNTLSDLDAGNIFLSVNISGLSLATNLIKPRLWLNSALSLCTSKTAISFELEIVYVKQWMNIVALGLYGNFFIFRHLQTGFHSRSVSCIRYGKLLTCLNACTTQFWPLWQHIIKLLILCWTTEC